MAEKLLALKKDSTLYLVDPQYPKPYPLYGFNTQEKPIAAELDHFNISPSKKWIVWYAPQMGIVALNVESLKTRTVQTSNDFLNNYPYVEFSPTQDTLHYITDKGNTFVSVDLNTFDETKIAIPYPYGNVFKIAPNQQKILFISGFGQSDKPQFMITDASGKLLVQFSADIRLPDRHLVFWSPDSLGLFMIDQNMLRYLPIENTDSSLEFYAFEKDTNILSTALDKNSIFILTDDGYWHIVDITTKKETARAPLEIASELSKPKFYPWTGKHFLIEETLDANPGQFQRLWLSDFRGVKKIVMDSYGEAIVQTYPEVID